MARWVGLCGTEPTNTHLDNPGIWPTFCTAVHVSILHKNETMFLLSHENGWCHSTFGFSGMWLAGIIVAPVITPVQKEQRECSLYIPTDNTEGSETVQFVLGVCLLECRGVRKHVRAYLQHVFRDSTFRKVVSVRWLYPVSLKHPQVEGYLVLWIILSPCWLDKPVTPFGRGRGFLPLQF